MTLTIFNLLQSQQGGGGGGMSLLIMLVLMFVIMYFFMIRPQQKAQKKIQSFRNSLEVGSRVLTSGGIYGTIKSLDPAQPYVTVEIAKGVTVQVDRNNIFADATQAAQASGQKK